MARRMLFFVVALVIGKNPVFVRAIFFLKANIRVLGCEVVACIFVRYAVNGIDVYKRQLQSPS